MSDNKHKIATDALETLGMLIPENSGRDAIHLAVEPTVAKHTLWPGQRVKITDGKAENAKDDATGIVDPFLLKPVQEGERFWFVVLPRTITSLRHVWSHPSFPEEPKAEVFVADADEHYVDNKERSIQWMKDWASEHMSDNYYCGDWEDPPTLSDEQAYANAIDAGRDHNVGPYEDARDHIDNEWWDHWENITGLKGKRDDYFSCSC